MVKPEICECMPADGTLTVQLWREDHRTVMTAPTTIENGVTWKAHFRPTNACSAGADINTLDFDDDF